MSYTPIGWQTGDTITAEKLNKMDNGWAVETTGGVLCEETLTTYPDPDFPEDPSMGTLTYSDFITAETLTVTFNGVDYTCAKVAAGSENYYGGYIDGDYVFSEYPFVIYSDGGGNYVYSEIAGTYSIKISASQKSIETSANFAEAVNSCITGIVPMLCVSGVTTRQQIAASRGAIKYFFPRPDALYYHINIITQVVGDSIFFYPESNQYSAEFVNDVFTVIYAS